ncbi:MAG: branched-chain amino acid transport system substrate-binding protein [Acidimicrobiaceae bacterium]|jgi:branched-chain amino acid transport system substrate-binding protein|nr:branched-chain amino acid transport system substrate-binding protein [Acidimicrobiaceae bacterium]
MRTTSRIRWWGTAGIAVAVISVAACGSSSKTSSSNSNKGKTLKLGAVFSLTGAGGVYGPQQQQAVKLAEETTNASGGVDGANLSIQVVDDASNQTQAAQQTQTLIQQNQVTALLGPTLSNSAVAAHPIADNLKTPMLAVSTTGLNIVGTCPYPCTYIFRDSLGEATAIPTNIKTYVASANPKPKTGVLLYPNDDKFSVDGATAVKQTVTDPAVGIQLLDTIQFSKSDADLTQFVNQGVSKHPDVIFITSLGGIPAKIMTAARQQGFTGQFLGGNGFNSAAVSKQAANFGKGAQSASAWYLGNDFASNAEFVKAFKAKYGTDPDQFAAQAYTGVLILVDAAKRAKLTYTDLPGDRQKLRTAMESTNIQTPLGPFQFTSTHDVHQTIWVIAMDGQGGFTLVTSVKPS